MVDKKSPMGFRLEYLPMSYELNPPVIALSTQEDSVETAQNQKFINCVTQVYFDFGCSWQYVSAAGPFPSNMVRGGVDSDGSVIYIGRAFHEGDMIPAKIIPDKNAAYVAYGGEEVLKEDFEVLRSGDFVWEFSTGGAVPEGALTCGATADGEPLYIGRVLHKGTQTPGKIQVSHGVLYIPFEGAEVPFTEYEVLCLK